MDLRPTKFENFCGQEDSVVKIKVAIAAAKMRNAPLGHVLISGFAGTGKTTFVAIIAQEYGVQAVATIGNNIRSDQSVFSLIKRVSRPNKTHILFIDEIHTVSSTGQNNLLTTMEDSIITVKHGQNSIRYEFDPIVVIGATTNPGGLLKPLYDRFDHKLIFTTYNIGELEKVIKFSVTRLDTINKITDKAATEIAQRAKGIPRIAIKHLQMAQNVAVTWEMNHKSKTKSIIDMDVIKETFDKILKLDENGLNSLTDVNILKFLFNKYPQPVGLTNMCQMIDEDPDHISKVVEPTLFKLNYISRERSGRVITPVGIKYLKSKGYITIQDTEGANLRAIN